jgi:hypothetical protein
MTGTHQRTRLSQTSGRKRPTAWLYSALIQQQPIGSTTAWTTWRHRLSETKTDASIVPNYCSIRTRPCAGKSGFSLSRRGHVRSQYERPRYRQYRLRQLFLAPLFGCSYADLLNYSRRSTCAETPRVSEYCYPRCWHRWVAACSPTVSQQNIQTLQARPLRFDFDDGILSRGAWAESASQFGTYNFAMPSTPIINLIRVSGPTTLWNS